MLTYRFGGHSAPYPAVSLAGHRSPWARSGHWVQAPGWRLYAPCLVLPSPPAPSALCSGAGPARDDSGTSPRPTSLHSLHRFAGHRSRPGKEEADFWAEFYTSKEAKNLPAARVGGAAGRDADHPGDRRHHLPGAVLLPPARRGQRR